MMSEMEGIRAEHLAIAVSLALTDSGVPCAKGHLDIRDVSGVITLPFEFQGLSPDRKTNIKVKGIAKVDFAQIGSAMAMPDVTIDLDERSLKRT